MQDEAGHRSCSVPDERNLDVPHFQEEFRRAFGEELELGNVGFGSFDQKKLRLTFIQEIHAILGKRGVLLEGDGDFLVVPFRGIRLRVELDGVDRDDRSHGEFTPFPARGQQTRGHPYYFSCFFDIVTLERNFERDISYFGV